MADVVRALLDAVPATAGTVLAIGRSALAGIPAWEGRNPHIVVRYAATLADLAAPAQGGRYAAAVVHLADCSGAALARLVPHLDRRATVAVLADSVRDEAAGRELLNEAGLVLDRIIPVETPATAEGETEDQPGGIILRGCLFQAGWPKLSVSAIPLSQNTEDLNGSVVRVRLREPFAQLATLPGVTCRILPNRAAPEVPSPDVLNLLIWQRVIFRAPNLDFVMNSVRRNIMTVIEIDDHPTFFKELVTDGGWAMFSSFHAIQTSTPELADYVRQFNSEVGVFANHAPEVRPLPVRPPGPVRVTFAAINRKAGWSEIAEAYRQTVEPYGRNVLTTVIGDREFFNALQPLHSVFMPVLAYAKYRAELEASHVALLPLADTEFDRAKTDLKFVECAQAGAAVLASPVVYGKSVVDGETGFIYRNADEFRARLRAMIEEPWLRERLARNAYAYLKRERLEVMRVQERYEWYLSLFRRREELTERLLQRVGVKK